MKHYGLGNSRRKGFQLTLPSLRTSRQELKHGRNLVAGANAAAMEGCRLLVCFSWLPQFCFLTEHRTTSPGIAPPTMGRALPHQSLIKKMPYRLAYSLAYSLELTKAFLLSDDFSFYHVDIQLSSIISLSRLPNRHAQKYSGGVGTQRTFSDVGQLKAEAVIQSIHLLILRDF
jgi:hypothetical protein